MTEEPKNEEINMEITEHMMSIHDVEARFETKINQQKPQLSGGLDEEQAKKLLEVNGPNVLSPPKQVHPAMMYLHCLNSPFNILLILASVLNVALFFIEANTGPKSPPKYELVALAGMLLIVVNVNATLEFWQMYKTASMLNSFATLMPQKAVCVRNGKTAYISARDLVIGDIVFTKMGDKLPADILLFSCSDMKVDNSSLTGESDPQTRALENEHKNPLEATNLAFNGSLVLAGEGYGIVIRTGDHTIIGQISGMTAKEKKNKSPLSIEIDMFVKVIASLASFFAVIFFIVAFCITEAKGGSNTPKLIKGFVFAIGLFVSSVPEGLPSTISVLLLVASKKMAKKKVLVKNLEGVETLGAITLLATDKTGTLTRNQMTVASIWTSLQLHATLRNIKAPGNPFNINSSGVLEILMNSTLNSRAKFNDTDLPIEKREIIGDATETGLLRFAAQNLDDFDTLTDKFPKVFEIPFNSDNKWAMTINEYEHGNGDLTLFLKGAPERVLRICNSILVDGVNQTLTKEHKKIYMESYEYMAGKGHRVLAFAQLRLNKDLYPKDYQFTIKDKNYPAKDLTFVGLVSLEDPPKHGVREAIGNLRMAGIRVMMVTGDHPLTAEAIGRKINLMISDTKEMIAKKRDVPVDQVPEKDVDAIVIHGEQIDSLADSDWETIFSKKEIIFSRTSPKHKLQIVKRAQAIGHIVGVTGDGVNDSPALKKADLGIAMNESGSDVSKEASTMILMDDNFASTVSGVLEGRLLFKNLKNSIKYTVTHSMPEILPQFVHLFTGIFEPLSVLLILAIDIFYETTVAISFAFDKPESLSALMKMQPRRPVNEYSIKRLQRIEARELNPEIDQESGKEQPITFIQKMNHKISMLFNADYWNDELATDITSAIDADIFSWGYLEIGIIQTVFCFLSYYSVFYFHNITHDKKLNPSSMSLNEVDKSEPENVAEFRVAYFAQFMFYISIIIMQMFNLFCCKSRIRYPFGRYLFTNKWNFILITVGIAFALLSFVISVAIEFRAVLLPSPKAKLQWAWMSLCAIFVPIIGGFVTLGYCSLRLYVLSIASPIKYNSEIKGLQMYPTVRTIRTTKK